VSCVYFYESDGNKQASLSELGYINLDRVTCKSPSALRTSPTAYSITVNGESSFNVNILRVTSASIVEPGNNLLLIDKYTDDVEISINVDFESRI
jgi:hypothetical protein